MSWGACLFGAINGAVWVGFCVSAICLSLAILLGSPRRRTDILKVSVVMGVGLLFETINFWLPLYSFTPNIDSWFPPQWMLCFWLAFAILFLEALKFLYSKHISIRFLAGVWGGAGYCAGEWLGLIDFFQPHLVTMSLFAVLWGVEFVLLLKICEFLEHSFES